METQFAFTVDETADTELASDGMSRYSAYLRQKTHMFLVDGQGCPPTEDTVEFACIAWTIARPPIMVPGYVSDHPRIQDATVRWDDDGRAALATHIAIPAPMAADRLSSRWRGWTRLPHSQGWVCPDDNQHITVLNTLTVLVPLDTGILPAPRYERGVASSDVAKRSIAALCETLNKELADLLTAIDDPLD
jgi:hypothetical protein